MPRFSRSRNGVEPPPARPGCGIISVDETANAVFAPGNANHDQVLDRERRCREAVTEFVVEGGHIPDQAAGLGVECDYVRVEPAQKNFIPQDGESSIYPSAAGTNVVRQLALVEPDRAAGAGIEGKGTIVLARTVKDS